MTYDVVTGRRDAEGTFRGASLTQEASPGFFKGRCYRLFKEFTANTVLQFVATKPFLLTSQRVHTDAGAARVAITTGSTPGGVFTALPSKFPKNGVFTPVPTPDVIVSEGGTATGGTTREVVRVNAGGGASAVSDIQGMRMLAPGTYWISIVVTGSTSGVYTLEYEELDV